MRKIALFFILFALMSFDVCISGQEIVWYNWEDGYQKAKNENKIILLDAYTEWCGWCKVMDEKTYTVKEIKEKVHKDFVAVKLNPELQGTYNFEGNSYSGPDLIKKLSHNKFRGYPTTFFVFPETGKSYMEIGYKKADVFAKLLDKYANMK